MKNTIVMLAFIATFLITWVVVSLFAWYLTDSDSFRNTMTNAFIFMLVIGWIPSGIVAQDLSSKFKLTKS